MLMAPTRSNYLAKAAKGAARQAAALLGPHRRGGGASRLWILMYHRILPPEEARSRLEEPGMWVSPDTFRSHIAWVRQHLEIVRLADWVRADPGARPARACAITFDDGWRDNHEHALAILREHQAPATLFAVSHMLGTRELFWPNRIARLLRAANDDAPAHPALEWLRQRAPLPRSAELDGEALSRIVSRCKAMPEGELTQLLDESERQLGLGELPTAELLDFNQLRDMADSGLVDIGSHTRRHVRLTAATPPETVAAEIIESQAALEQALGRPVRSFCYPNGDTCAQALALVRQHYDAAVTTRLGINTPATPPHELMRIGLHQDISATRRDFLARLSGWL